VRTGGQLEWDTIDRFFFRAIDYPADDSVVPYSIKIAIFFADAFSAYLSNGSHALEVPVNVIWRSDVDAH
jgi:hypothetical protein